MRTRLAKGFGALVAALVLLVGVTGCPRAISPWQKGSPRVLVTIAPLESFARNVAGDHADIKCLCTTKGPHSYEYDVQDTLLTRDGDLFFAVGLGLDDKFADKMSAQSHNPRLRYVKFSDRLPAKLKRAAEHEHGHDHDAKGKDEKGHAHEHEHGEYDPHVWMGVEQAKAMVEVIRDELQRVDPAHAEEYAANAAKYAQALDNLLQGGRALFKDKASKRIVTFHESLAYFANSFGLDIVETIEESAGQEPSAGHLAELVEVCKDKKVSVIAVEPQYPQDTSARIVQKELAKHGLTAKMVEVDPLETADPKQLQDPAWYENKMRHNVEELAKALP
jgi:ABC-type Zn uptake system ZnuABC Zn-binding protein ZnuA